MSSLGLIVGTGSFFLGVWLLLRRKAKQDPGLHICEFSQDSQMWRDHNGFYYKCIHGCEQRCYDKEFNVFGEEKHV